MEVRIATWQLRTIPWAVADNPYTDFEKTFIQCIVYNYDVMREYGDEAKTKAAGKVMTKGKDYVVMVCSFNLQHPKDLANLAIGWRHYTHQGWRSEVIISSPLL